MAIAYSFDCFGLSYSLNMKTDDTDPDFTYIGYCVPGTLASETGWAIIRITKADGGNANLNTAS